MPGGRRGRALPWLTAAGFLLLAYAADSAQQASFRRSLVALDTGDVGLVCAVSGYRAADFWERAKAMGVGAVALRQETIGDLANRGQVLIYTRPELEKWKSVGLITPAASLKSNTLWVKDQKLYLRIANAMRAQGLVASTATAAGYGLVELIRDPDASMPAGLDPEGLEAAANLDLRPLRLAASGKAWLDEGDDIAAFGLPRTIEPGARLPVLLRAFYSQPGRVLILRLDPGTGLEENLSRMRGLLRPLRDRGLIGPRAPGPAPAPEPPAARWRRWLAWLFAVLGPIVAVRLGVKGFKRVRLEVQERWPVASPVADLAAGACAAGLAACAAGLVVALLLAGSSASKLPESLAFSTMAWPLAIGVLALYPLSMRVFLRRLRVSPTYGDLLKFAALAAVAALLFKPRFFLAGTLPWAWIESVGDASAVFWWWPWRWREVLVGLPAFLHALYLVGRQADGEPAHPRRGVMHDPRPWLWLGMLFPIGAIAALGRPGAPAWMVLGQTAGVLAVGLALGGGLLVLRGLWEAWVQSPAPPRSIDL